MLLSKNLYRISGVILLTFFIHFCKEEKPIPPHISSMPVSEISSTSAISGGTITYDGGSEIMKCGVCWSIESDPSITDNITSDTAVENSFVSRLNHLDGGTTYYIRAYAKNIAGTVYGTTLSFTTLGLAPTAATGLATSISTTEATLNGLVNPNYLSTIVEFEYGTSTTYGSTIIASQSPIIGNSNAAVSSDVKDLTPGTIYHVRTKSTNSLGIVFGNDVTFRTQGQKPNASTAAAINITTTSATLNGYASAGLLSTDVSFEYGTTVSYGTNIISIQSPLGGFLSTSISADINGLQEGTTYHYRIKASNSMGITYGNDMIFKTLGAIPSVTTLPSSSVYITGATLHGTVNANYLQTLVTFEYGTSTIYGETTTATLNQVSGNSITNINATISGLTIGTVYHYRIKAVNSLGTSYGNDMTFTTFGPAPSANTQAPTGISTTSVNLNGNVNAHYLSTSVIFEWGLSSRYGSSSEAFQSPLLNGTNTNVALTIFNLNGNTSYHFRVKATNSLGSTYGNDMIFTTPSTLSDIDGNNYTEVIIGDQVWIAENLKTTKFNDNSNIPLVTDLTTWQALTTSGYCWYNDDEATNKNVFGALYNWYTVNSGKLCPIGWHVPSDADWTIMENYLIANGYNFDGTTSGNKIAKALGAKTNWSLNSGTGSIGNTDYPIYRNKSGFSALPGGSHIWVWASGSLGFYGHWWSSTESSSTDAWNRNIYYSYTMTDRRAISKNHGISVRCIKD